MSSSHHCVGLPFVERNQVPILNQATRCHQCGQTARYIYEDFDHCHHCNVTYATITAKEREAGVYRQRQFRFEPTQQCFYCKRYGLKKFVNDYYVQCVHCNQTISIN